MFWRFARAAALIFVFLTLLASGGFALSEFARRTKSEVLASSNNPASFGAPKMSAARTGGFYGPPSFTAVATGDFNGDDVLDFAAVGLWCSSGLGSKVAVFLGNGDGTFGNPKYFPAGDCVGSVAVARLRGPNAPEDLIVGTIREVSILAGNGDGTFGAPQVAATFPDYQLTQFTVADFNRDGKPDLAVSLFGGLVPASPGLYDAVAVLLGNGNGSFQAPLLSQSPADNNYTIGVGDFNNDGKLDVLTRPGLGQHGLYLSLGNGDGTFLPAYLVWTEPISIFITQLNGINSFAVGDLNDDGNLDVGINIDGARVDVLLGTGTGAFASTGTILINQHQGGGNGLGQIATAKLSPDGHVDLIVGTGYGATLVILRGNGDGTFQAPVIYPLPQTDDEGLIVSDLNGDGAPDIAIGTDSAFSRTSYLTVLLNEGNGDFGPPPELFSIVAPYDQATATNAVGLTLADLANSGKLDLVVTTWNTPIEPAANGQVPPLPSLNMQGNGVNTRGSIAVLAGNGDGTFQTEQQFYVDGRRPIAVAIGDLDGDGKKDVVTVNAVDNNMSILRGNGDRTFQTSIAIDVGTNPTSIALADLNGDNKPDVIETNLVDNTVSVLMNQSTPGNISMAPRVNYTVPAGPDAVLTGDFNHDGKPDLAVLSAGNQFASDDADKHTQLSILLGNGDGTFAGAPSQIIDDNVGGETMVAADFGRGEIDLAITHFGNSEVIICHGNGHGGFAKVATYGAGDGAEGLVASDLNGDGKIDLAVAGLNDDGIAILEGNGDGTFKPALPQGGPAISSSYGRATWHYPAFMAAADLNGDSKPELITTHLFEAAAAVLKNTTPTPVQLAGVVSRKVHGSAGTFDVDLANGGIECRSGGANGDYTLVFTFANTLSTVDGANLSGGTGSVSSRGFGSDRHQYVVNLTGVTSPAQLTVALTNARDDAGNSSANVTTTFNALAGDTTADRSVNSADISQTKSQSGANLTIANFREDLNADGAINSADIALAKSKSGTALPNQ